MRVLKTPREVRRALAYVLLNARKHYFEARRGRPPVVLDVCSSGAWFDGWRHPPPARERDELLMVHPDVAEPRTWMLTTGWRRHGLLDPGEVPGAA